MILTPFNVYPFYCLHADGRISGRSVWEVIIIYRKTSSLVSSLLVLLLFIYIYIYIYVCVCVCVCIYIYIYTRTINARIIDYVNVTIVYFHIIYNS
jgi:hypothetical protein